MKNARYIHGFMDARHMQPLLANAGDVSLPVYRYLRAALFGDGQWCQVVWFGRHSHPSRIFLAACHASGNIYAGFWTLYTPYHPAKSDSSAERETPSCAPPYAPYTRSRASL